MRVLLDHCVDIRFKIPLSGFEVAPTKEMGWENLSNGKLLSAAEEAGFRVFITVDKNLRFQQNLSKKVIAVITLASVFTVIDHILPLAPKVIELIESGVDPGRSYLVGPQ